MLRVYEKVRAYMDEMGYKQVTIAEKAGIPKATFNAILNGKRVLYADDLKAICLALNVSPELFIESGWPYEAYRSGCKCCSADG